MAQFEERLLTLPRLGMGVSTEYGAFKAPNSLNLQQLHNELPQCSEVLEIGVEVAKGLDADALDWIQEGRATTYHFLDINLSDPADFDPYWIKELQNLIKLSKPAWLCGDAGLWHHGPRAEGHMLLLPPILTQDAAYALADGIIKLRETTGLEVFPENPPGHVFIGPLHILDFFAIVMDRADTGMLLDLAHLSIYQHSQNLPLHTALDGFPCERVIELHMAGGSTQFFQGLEYIEDDHNPEILALTWSLFEMISPRLTELRAVIFECERNPLEKCRNHMLELRTSLDQNLPLGSRWRKA